MSPFNSDSSKVKQPITCHAAFCCGGCGLPRAALMVRAGRTQVPPEPSVRCAGGGPSEAEVTWHDLERDSPGVQGAQPQKISSPTHSLAADSRGLLGT